MKKNILIGLLILILIIIPVGVLANKREGLYIPDEIKKERTLTYREDAPYTISEEKSEWENENKESSEEHNIKVEKAHEILKKYNPQIFDEIYNEVKSKNAQDITREMEEIDETAYTMVLNTYDNEQLTEKEKEILKESIIEAEEHIRKIPSLVQKLDKIINE